MIIIAQQRTIAATRPLGSLRRQIADLWVDWLDLKRQADSLRSVSAECNKITSDNDDLRSRPYLKWQCCDKHRELAKIREALRNRASNLGLQTQDAFSPAWWRMYGHDYDYNEVIVRTTAEARQA